MSHGLKFEKIQRVELTYWSTHPLLQNEVNQFGFIDGESLPYEDALFQVNQILSEAGEDTFSHLCEGLYTLSGRFTISDGLCSMYGDKIGIRFIV